MSLPTATPSQARRRLGRLLVDRRGRAAVVLALAATATGARLAGPALIGLVVGAVAEGTATHRLVALVAGGHATAAVVGALLAHRGLVRAAALGEDALAELRTEVFDHAVGLPLADVERAGTGELVSRVTGDVSVLTRTLRSSLPSVVFALLEVGLTTGALLLLDVRLAAAALGLAAPAVLLGGRWYQRRAPARYRRERQGHADLAAALLGGYRGAATIAAHRATARRRDQLAAAGAAVVDAEMASTRARNVLRPAVSAGQAMGLVGVVAVGGALAGADAVGVGTVTAAALYLIRLFDPVGVLLEELDEVQQASAALARLVGVTLLPAEPPDRGAPPGVGRAGVPPPVLQVQGVTTGYEAGEPVLRAVDLDIAPGERIAVVGASGAGKTTLARVLTGAQPCWAGQVLVDGVPLQALGPRQRAATIALVAQDAHVFLRSIADNVAMAAPGADADGIRRALAAVGARSWVDALPEGAATPLGPGHHEPTPAEAQQVALARIACAAPAVVVLDESTAELDPAEAARVEALLATALGDRTVVTIAHRLDVAARADRVLVMEAGTIVADGPHARLLAEGGAYAALWEGWQAARAGRW